MFGETSTQDDAVVVPISSHVLEFAIGLMLLYYVIVRPLNLMPLEQLYPLESCPLLPRLRRAFLGVVENLALRVERLDDGPVLGRLDHQAAGEPEALRSGFLGGKTSSPSSAPTSGSNAKEVIARMHAGMRGRPLHRGS